MSGNAPQAAQAPFVGAEMRAVRRELAGASDQRVLDVLRFVDSLNDRTQADSLLAPLRDRLRALRPPRPLRFARLLFEPLTPALVNPTAWRTGMPALPRSAIAPMVATVRRAIPAIAADVEAIIAEPDISEIERLQEAGRLLWAEAGRVLRTAKPPAEWQDTSLPPAAFTAMASAAAGVLENAWTLVEQQDPSITDAERNAALCDLLGKAEAEGVLAWGMLLTVLVQRFPQAEGPLRIAALARTDRPMREAAAAALQAAWAWLESATADIGLGDPAEAALAVRRQVALLEELSRDPANRRRATELQTALRATCATRFQAGVEQFLLTPLQAMTQAEAGDTGVLAMLENDARGLRQLDIDSRRLGCGAAHDAQLAEAAKAIAARTDIPAIDRARLLEILRGPQAALAAM
jgi:hypothetical protein